MNWSPFEIELLYHRHCRPHCGRLFFSFLFCYFRQIANRHTQTQQQKGTNETWSTNGAQPIQKVVRVHRKTAFWPLFHSSCFSFHISFASKSIFAALFTEWKTKKTKIKLSFYFGFSDACAKVVPLFWRCCTLHSMTQFAATSFPYEILHMKITHACVCTCMCWCLEHSVKKNTITCSWQNMCIFLCRCSFLSASQVRPNKQLNASKMHKTKCFGFFLFSDPTHYWEMCRLHCNQ